MSERDLMKAALLAKPTPPSAEPLQEADMLPISVAARAFLISRFDQYVSEGDCRALEKLIGDYAQPQQPSPPPSDPMTDAQMRQAAKHDNSCVGAFARARPRKPTK